MRPLTSLASAWALLGGLGLLAVVAVTTVNAGAFALDRLAGLFGANVEGLPGYEDFVALVIGAATPMFLPYAQARRGHLAVDLFARRLGPRFRRASDAAGLALTAAMALFLAYWMVIGMAEVRADGRLSRVLGWPVWPFYLTGIASLALWALVALAQLFARPGAAAEGAHG